MKFLATTTLLALILGIGLLLLENYIRLNEFSLEMLSHESRSAAVTGLLIGFAIPLVARFIRGEKKY
jgi:Na+-translocating ferredoxin:NAD+ oxidoreductase RnfD subunit